MHIQAEKLLNTINNYKNENANLITKIARLEQEKADICTEKEKQVATLQKKLKYLEDEVTQV